MVNWNDIYRHYQKFQKVTRMLNFPKIVALSFCSPMFNLAKGRLIDKDKKKKILVRPLCLICRISYIWWIYIYNFRWQRLIFIKFVYYNYGRTVTIPIKFDPFVHVPTSLCLPEFSFQPRVLVFLSCTSGTVFLTATSLRRDWMCHLYDILSI